MKLVIPPECQMGAHTIDIVWSRKILELMECKGGSEYLLEHKIRLMPGRPLTQILQTLNHEAIHQVDHIFGVGNLNEEQVRILAAGLTQFLMSVGIEPDFSRIPEEKL